MAVKSFRKIRKSRNKTRRKIRKHIRKKGGISLCDNFDISPPKQSVFNIMNNDLCYNYEFVEEEPKIIAAGSSGKIFKIKDKQGKIYALKQIFIMDKQDESEISPVEQTIKNEIDILKYLNKNNCNPSFVCYHDSYEKLDNNGILEYFIITEFLDDYIDLGSFILNIKNNITSIYDNNTKQIIYKESDYSHTSPFTTSIDISIYKDTLESIINKLTNGILLIHQNNIVHRDIKPANIMINKKTGNVKIIDFGESCLETTKSKIGDMTKIAGTSDYIDHYSIECKIGNKTIVESYTLKEEYKNNLDHLKKCDYWSLGITLFEVIFCYLYSFGKITKPLHISDTITPTPYDLFCIDNQDTNHGIRYHFYVSSFPHYMQKLTATTPNRKNINNLSENISNLDTSPTQFNDEENTTCRIDDKQYELFKQIMETLPLLKSLLQPDHNARKLSHHHGIIMK
jgi:serine/threonine protein kinase